MANILLFIIKLVIVWLQLDEYFLRSLIYNYEI